ncbi:MAG TPA: DUF3043 domain-containing protein [Streptosporangiaceae bacterium]|nr:DUF3043 domain-containing protein [Streptosporangiaceae bacterium]
MFRRRSNDASGLLDQDEAAAGLTEDEQARPARSSVTAPKGAPTPKRSEAQGSRRGPYQAPTDRKAAAQQSRARGRDDRARRTQALQRGESWALPRKDQGEVRALARDVVDARRGIGEWYMIMVFVLIVLLVLPGSSTKVIADAVVVALLAVIIGEGWLVSNKVKRLAAERFPGQSTHGVAMYTVMRGISMRRMRVPKPRVNRGDQV